MRNIFMLAVFKKESKEFQALPPMSNVLFISTSLNIQSVEL